MFLREAPQNFAATETLLEVGILLLAEIVGSLRAVAEIPLAAENLPAASGLQILYVLLQLREELV